MALERALCPRFHKAVELIGARWTGAIVQLLLAGRARFTDLRAAIPEISDRMLSERLRELEAEGIVARSVVPDVPVRVEYTLTRKGEALHDALDAIARWSATWVSVEEEPEGPNRRRSEGPRAGKADVSGRAGRAGRHRVKP
jgi:DNA-binding HxlR family transcriptional regulator